MVGVYENSVLEYTVVAKIIDTTRIGRQRDFVEQSTLLLGKDLFVHNAMAFRGVACSAGIHEFNAASQFY